MSEYVFTTTDNDVAECRVKQIIAQLLHNSGGMCSGGRQDTHIEKQTVGIHPLGNATRVGRAVTGGSSAKDQGDTGAHRVQPPIQP